MASRFFAIVAGVGPGTGRSVALRFAKAYPVVLLARNPEHYNSVVEEIKQSGGQAWGISTDTTDEKSVASAFEIIQKELPDQKLAAAIYNVGAGRALKGFLDLNLDDLRRSVEGNAYGLFNFAKKVVPLLLQSVNDSPYPPTLVITGATASLRGSARFADFAAGKFAERALGQSLAREFGPQGVHVAHAVIDGAIDIPRLQSLRVNDGKPDGKINPDAIADSYWYLHTQHRSHFTQELDVRPYVEKF